MTLPDNLVRDARNYVARTFGIDVSDVPFVAIRATIEHTFEGGWNSYVTDFHATLSRLTGTTEVMSPVKQKILAKEWLRTHAKINLKPFDEVRSFRQSDDRVQIVLSRATVIERHREDRVTMRSTEVHIFTRIVEDGKVSWKYDHVELDEAVDEAHRRFGYIYTPERAADQAWQVSECYRPGTPTSPMDGAVRKLEMSHEDAFGKVQPSAEQIAERNNK